MLLLLDNYDSFTYNLKDYFEQLGESVLVVKNDELSVNNLSEINFNKLVLSPGPKKPCEAGNMMTIIDSLHKQMPILGVCLGHQALGEYFGAQLCKATRPMHGKISQITHSKNGIYNGINSPLKVCRYNSLIINQLDKTELNITAESEEMECMSFQHSYLPITGIQYHPEAILTEHGLKILQNWLDMT